jgi:hypothetical protein
MSLGYMPLELEKGTLSRHGKFAGNNNKSLKHTTRGFFIQFILSVHTGLVYISGIYLFHRIEYSPCNRPTDHSANSSPLSPLLVPTRWKFTSVLLTNSFAHAFPQERDDEYRRVFASLCPSERLLQAPKSEPRFEDQGTTPSAAWSYCTSLTPPGLSPTHRLAPLPHEEFKIAMRAKS